MKKNDIRLIGLIVLVALVIMGYLYIKEEEGVQVVVTVDGEEYGDYDLSEDQTILIQGTNTFQIQSRKVFMTKADCPDKLCVHHKPIFRDGESIICLPNKVVVSTIGGKKRDLDAVTN